MDKVEALKVKLQVDYKVVVEAYLEVSSKGWAINTQIVEAARIRTLIPMLEKFGLDPESLYLELIKQGLAAYTIKAKFIRLKRLADFCKTVGLYEGLNPFETFMKYTAPNKFKKANVYKPKAVQYNYDEVKTLILETFEDETSIKDSLLFLLNTGLRISELYKLEKSVDGKYFVVGKGGKIRPVLFSPPQQGIIARNKLVKALVKLKLTPHQVRKLTATKLANSGILAHELQEIMGWSSITTAQIYLQQTSTNELHNKVKGLL